jgi:hypothetical protein
MRKIALALPILIAGLVSGQARAQQTGAQQPTPELQALDDALPGTLINDPSRMDWDVFGPGQSHKPVKGADIPGGGAALQVTVPKAGQTLYEIGSNAPITAAILPGQQIVVAFYARTIKAATPDGKGIIGVRFQQNAAPYPGFGDTTLAIGPTWDLYEVRATANKGIAKGLAVVGFQLSGAKQTIEIGQAIVVEGAASIKSRATTISAPAPIMLPQLQGKGKLINDPASQAWAFYGTGGTPKPVSAKGMPGGSALQFTVQAAAAKAYESGANVPIGEAVAQGDVLTVAFLARTLSAATPDGIGKITVRVQQNKAPDYPGFGENTMAVGPNWKLYQMRTQAKIDVPKGQGAIALQLAGAKQSLEIGPVYVLNAGPPPAQ